MGCFEEQTFFFIAKFIYSQKWTKVIVSDGKYFE